MNQTAAPHEALILQDDGSGVITTEQELTPLFWRQLQNSKDDFRINLDGLTHVAAVPESLANIWLRQGFDLWSAPANEIIKKLRSDNMEAFIVSGDTRFDH
ncbi:hypothetical protein [Paracoccus sp. (in: a-proteobacteria)]|uniref:hypothetical protein n=1 Tax=Paracoccus sp. TaxID=267 RepID=UPI0026E077C8|nr:hypothetical protein [Paracoccus sp. (in: a-proteobacteria)]MDO5647365.1 hypothetical protein [Paracoccus sp. (in: a-proteobacteria)]